MKEKEWTITQTLVKSGSSIGANATIVCGNIVGENSLVGAGSVVTKNVEPNTLSDIVKPAFTYSNACRAVKNTASIKVIIKLMMASFLSPATIAW